MCSDRSAALQCIFDVLQYSRLTLDVASAYSMSLAGSSGARIERTSKTHADLLWHAVRFRAAQIGTLNLHSVAADDSLHIKSDHSKSMCCNRLPSFNFIQQCSVCNKCV
jgi:hypothetical protein